MSSFDIRNWVTQDASQKSFREAVHTILIAISGSPVLQDTMIMKGGILLALRYQSTRYTKDIDFSTGNTLKEFDLDAFIRQFSDRLVTVVDSLDYGLNCVIQSFKQDPQREDATAPTIRITVGYAYKSDHRAHKRLLAKNCPHIVKIDYSLNEPSQGKEVFDVGAGLNIKVYTIEELVAEKFRALLQQEERNRFRRQDIYDLHFILLNRPECMTPTARANILENIQEKARIRCLGVSRESMADPEIRRRSAAEYGALSVEIEEDLLPFDAVYEHVLRFYESLPWDKV